MPRECTVCRHPDIDEINEMLQVGIHKDGEVGKKYGFTARTINHHKNNHLKKIVTPRPMEGNKIAKKEETPDEVFSLADQLTDIQNIVKDICQSAIDSDNNSLALQAVKERRGQLETAVKVLTEMRQQAELRNQKDWKGEWEEVRLILSEVFAKFPDAGDMFDQKLFSRGLETFEVSI